MFCLDGTYLYVVYSWDGYESEFSICKIFTTEKAAKKYCQYCNLNYVRDATDGEHRYIDEEGNINWGAVDSEDFYYTFGRVALEKPTDEGGADANS